MIRTRLRIIVTGLIAQYPLGGVAWDYFQYLLGLDRLGHDVFYFEDTGLWPYSPDEGGTSKGYEFSVRYISELMDRFGFADKWTYCFPWKSQWFGLSDSKRTQVVNTADMLINVSGVLRNPWDYRNIETLVYIDSDPVFTQIKLARGQVEFSKMVGVHDVQFSFGEALSHQVPETPFRWLPTRQPIVITEWQTNLQHRNVFTTVMNWTSYKPIVFNGQIYGQKDIEFYHFLDLPSIIKPSVIELAVNEGRTKHPPRDLLRNKGWCVVDPAQVCPDLDSYKTYLQSSKAEWSVAKNGYVVGQAGWFSCRSACYLAAGRPVVVEDTGFSRVLPVGMGILPFTTLEEAAEAIYSIEGDYRRHSEAARAIANQYFDSNKVLHKLIEDSFSAK